MQNVNKPVEKQSAVVSPEGRLENVTAPVLEKALQDLLPGLTELKPDYISSADLRVLQSGRKVMNKQSD